MANKGLDAVLSRDQEEKKKMILEGLKRNVEEVKETTTENTSSKKEKKEPPKESEGRADVNKYFRIMNEGRKKSPAKKNEPEEKKDDSKRLNEEIKESDEVIEVQEDKRIITEDIKEEKSKFEEVTEVEELIKDFEEPVKKNAEDKKEALSPKEPKDNVSVSEFPEKEQFSKLAPRSIGKEITKEEAEEISKSRPVLRRTILITQKEEIEEPEPLKEEVNTLTFRKTGEIIDLDKPTYTIGRGAQNDICITDEIYVSTIHAELFKKSGKFMIRDLNSTNGTLLNGKEITEEELSSGDIITFADVECLFE